MDVSPFIMYFPLGFLAISILILILIYTDYYIICNYRLLFIISLAFGRSLTDYAIISVLILYFTSHRDFFATSAILTNIQGSLSSLLVIFMAHVADSYVGRFHTLLFSNTAYIGGLLLLWMFNPYDVKWLVVISLVLLSLGSSGANILQDVLTDLVHDIDKSQDRTRTRSLARATIWSRIAYVSGVFSAILLVPSGAFEWVHPFVWETSFLYCIFTMTVALMIFCMGYSFYHQGELRERPAEVFYRVFRERIKNTKSPKKLETKGKEAKKSTSYNQEDIVVVKRLLRMFPMWAMFFVVSLISASSLTFFLQQHNNLNDISIPIQIYNIVQDFSRFVAPFLYNWICGSRENQKVKIGVGMLCGIISCIFAWQLEVYRLKEVYNTSNKDGITSISFLWLVPQFCVLGCMEGLTGEGLLKFYRSQMKEEPLLSYGEEYIEFVMGLGKLINIFLILVIDSQCRWFGDTINKSRLDKYYLVLVYLCLANFILYCCVARYFYKDQDLGNDDQERDNQVLVCDDQKQDNQILANDYQKQDNQVLANDDHKQGNQRLANDDLKQDNQDDDRKQDNQVLAHDGQEQDNESSLANNNHVGFNC